MDVLLITYLAQIYVIDSSPQQVSFYLVDWKLTFVYKHKNLFRPPIKITARLLLLLLNQSVEQE